MQIDISHIPQEPGVYLFKDSKGIILYIGKAKNLQKRVSQYFTPNSLWKQEMVAKASKVDFFVVANESESLYLENNLIKKHKPFFNCMLKGGNGYTYIKLTDSDFPQVLTTRNKRNDKATYIGPKHNTKELKKLMQYLRTILKYRTCLNSQFNQGKICSDFYFGLCNGRCEKCKNKSELSELKEQYKKDLQMFSSFFKGNTKPIEKELLSQIDDAVSKQNFEWASQIRDIYMHIEELVEKQHVELGKNLTGYVLAIKEISSSYISILLNFYEGKLIDIVRQDTPIDDGDIYWIKSGFEAEIGDLNIQEGVSEFSLLAYSNKVSFNKEEKSALINMLEGFFDSYVISSTLQGPGLHNQLLEQLQSRYKFKNFPNWIECVDISHMNGDWISGGLSCIVGGIPDKRKYRKYKIKSVSEQSDDYASLKEVIQRRFLKKSPFGKGDAPQEQGDIYKKQFLAYNPNLVEKAKELRKNMTKAEKKLRYQFLQPLDIKVLRQQPIDEYIVDFYIASKKLVIEIDGDTHWMDEEIKYDEKRTKILNNLGLTVIRFTNDDVFNNFESVCEEINNELEKEYPPFIPPYQRGAEDIPPLSPLTEGGRDLPDVFILDGGIGQLNVVKDLCKESSEFHKIFQQVDFVSLGKGEARRKSGIGLASKRGHEGLVGEKIYRFIDDKFNIEEIPMVYDQADRFLVKLRDEAHRFSNSYRKQQMKNELKSEFKKVKK